MVASHGFYVAPKETDDTPSLDGIPPEVFERHSQTCTARRNVKSWEASINFSAINGCLLCALWLRAIRATATCEYNTFQPFENGPGIAGFWEEGSQRNDHFIDIYTDSGNSNDIPNIVRGRSPSGDTGSVIALCFIEEQIKYCLNKHTSCGNGSEASLPTRLLDISDSTSVRLKVTAGKYDRYAALSHAWGGKISLQTTSTTLESHSRGILINRLPKSFQDAVDFCRKIGLKYLWIDSLCIIQDDLSDWHRESAQMKEIYSNAFIVVAATASSNGDGGCYQVKKDSRKRVAQVQCSSSLVDVYARKHWRHVNPINYNRRFSRTNCPPLLKRAWAFQERLLAARIVHFTADEIIWECRELEVCECLMTQRNYLTKAGAGTKQTFQSHFKEGFPPNLAASQNLPLAAHWRLLVGDYSELSISFAKDRLPALSGVARSFHNLGLGNYYAGLWEKNLMSWLAWRAFQPTGPRLKNHSPSWSWSSISSAVCFYGGEITRGSIVSVHCEPVGEDAFGEIRGGRVVLKVDLVSAWPVPVRFLSPKQQIINQNGNLSPVGVALNGKAFNVFWDTNECCSWSFADVLDDPAGEGPACGLESIQAYHTLSKGIKPPMLYAFNIASDSSLVVNYYLILICENENKSLFRRVGFMIYKVHDKSADIAASVESSRFSPSERVMGKSGSKSTIITLI